MTMMRLCSRTLRGGIVHSITQTVRHRHFKTRNPFRKVKPLSVKLKEPDGNGLLGSDRSSTYDFDDAEDDPEEVLEHVEHYYDRHMEELRLERRKARTAIIRRKYFKDLFPPETNLLSWAAKEQIRYLHNLDPSEWTVEKIAQCFPVSVLGAKKLLKSQFRKETAEQIAEHDRNVQLKWKALKTGKGNEYISPTTKKLFMEGKLQEDQAYGNKTLPMPQQGGDTRALELSRLSPKPGEYSKLIATYLKLKNPEKSVSPKKYEQASRKQAYDDVYTEDMAAATSLKKMGSLGSHVRIDEFKAAETKFRHYTGEGVDRRDAIHVGSENVSDTPSTELQDTGGAVTPEGTTEDVVTFDILEAHKYRKDDTLSHRVRSDIAENYNYSEDGDEAPSQHITIPSHLKKRETAVYKVGKCYYDEDGEILFKVP
ncbi:uncharacterized protein LOC119170049 [Rhipicephalus microplus]|uniref:uncharacterized protein LOC119170049 n=1 Tax=Rhipicephalus microplus TaxID=6941 RepID=UPI003F6AD56B